MWKGPKEFFNYTRKEKNGSIVLLFVILILWALYFTFDFYKKGEQQDFTVFQNYVTQWELKDSIAQSSTLNSKLFNFDPNTIKKAELKLLGLKDYQIATFNNYRKSGGYFKDAEDLHKVYSLDSTWVIRVRPYVKIYDRFTKSRIEYSNTDHMVLEGLDSSSIDETSNKKLVDINTSDSIGLMSINGIGPVFANRILKYRELLGGFVEKEQLLEVYGIDSLKLESISKQIIIHPNEVSLLNINMSSFKELLKHPYLDFESVKALVNFRNKVRSFESVDEIRNIEGITDSLFIKVSPYLTTKD